MGRRRVPRTKPRTKPISKPITTSPGSAPGCPCKSTPLAPRSCLTTRPPRCSTGRVVKQSSGVAEHQQGQPGAENLWLWLRGAGGTVRRRGEGRARMAKKPTEKWVVVLEGSIDRWGVIEAMSGQRCALGSGRRGDDGRVAEGCWTQANGNCLAGRRGAR